MEKFYYNRNNRGSIYLMALVAMMILYIVVMVFMQKLLFNIQSLKHGVNDLQSYHIAHAGFEDTLSELKRTGGPYFNSSGWVTDVAGQSYHRPFPMFGGAEYQGTYYITIDPQFIFNSGNPATFNIRIEGVLDKDGSLYAHNLYAEGLWTLGKRQLFITQFREE